MVVSLRSAPVRKAFSAIARIACERFVSTLPIPRQILNRKGDSLYLERYYLMGGPSEEGFADTPMTVCFHRFARSDEDGALHNHPWEQSVSFVLAGGYSEERRVRRCTWCQTVDESKRSCIGGTPHVMLETVERRDVPPFSINFIASGDFHRVDLYEEDCWSLFVTTRKTGSWGFWNRETKEYKPWRAFIAELRGVDPSTMDHVKQSELIGKK